jgi:exopolyphosphatase / guanosine-5'-triphosphate,3'-diphosphate pyrophosphatase
MRLAAIDIGTNSLHMIVVRVRADLSFEVIDREKEMVRLGAGGLDGRALTPEAMHAALQVMSKFRRLADSHGVDEIIAVATSATREAENGSEFLKAIIEKTGIRPRVISGTEEARLIHQAAAYGVGLAGEVGVVIDIGGGSVEITRGVGLTMETGRSFKIGVIRLTERFVKSDPLAARDQRKLTRFIENETGKFLGQIAKQGFDRVIGTSGTIQSIGAVALAERGESTTLRNRRVTAKQIRRVRKQLLERDLEERLRVPGLEPRRADLAVAGSILLDAIVRRLGAADVTLCDLSLREGIILDYIARHRKQIVQADRYPDVRRRSVFELAERCNYWPEHAQQVARLATMLFDQTRSVHGMTDHEREWLEYASILHDIGVHISYERHHKHSYYLVKNGDLRGFDPEEVENIALIARYHRQAPPKRSHEGYGDLKRKRRRRIRSLAAMLRLAEGLDRSHSQPVASLELHDRGEDGLLQLRATGDAELELWAAARHAAEFERLIGKPVRVEVSTVGATASTAAAQASASVGHSHAEQPHDTTRVPGQAVRRRRHRRLGQDDTARAFGEVADGGRSSRVRHGMELVRPRQGGDENRKEEERANADDVQPSARN